MSGRTKLSKEQKLAAVADAQATNQREAAARAGVSVRTLRRWERQYSDLAANLVEDMPSSAKHRPAQTPAGVPDRVARQACPVSGQEDKERTNAGLLVDILWEEFPGLSLQEKAFVIAYTGRHLGNGTRAAMEAGYGSTYSASCTHGCKLLKRPDIHQAVKALFRLRIATKEELQARISARARADVSHYICLDDEGKPSVNLEQLKQDGLGFLLKEVRLLKGGTVAFRFSDPQKAEDQMARMLGLYKDKVEHTHRMGLEDLEAANREADQELDQERTQLEEEMQGLEGLFEPGPEGQAS